jgi:tetratricopeptide (TPR) repeat protein
MERNRRRWRIGILFSIIFTLILPGSKILAQDSFDNSADFRIARRYLQQARMLYGEGRYESAAELLEVSLEFFPDYSESAYLCARVYIREQETTWKAIDCLEAAVRSGTWTETEPLAGTAELIRLYVRTSRFQDARRLFEAIGETGLGGRSNPELSTLWASTLLGLGRSAEAQAFLSEAVRRFPRSPRVYILLAEVLSSRGNRGAARELLQRGISELPDEAELTYRLAVLESDTRRQRELIEAYFQVGGSDPAAALLAISGARAERDRFLDLFFRLGGNNRIGYLDRLLDSVSLQEISERTGSYTGTRIRDQNRDGYYEQRYEYQEGILTRWVSDQDQNGVAEATVDFRNGIPSRVTLGNGDGSAQLEYRYSEYPYLDSVSLTSGTSRREYLIVPYTLRRPAFLSLSEEQFALQLQPRLRMGEDFIRQNAYQGIEYSDNGILPERRVRRTQLLEGRIVRVDELPDSEGNFTRTLYYAASLPVEGIRDLDGDGNPEIREEFRNGRLWKITLDQDGDGVNEFEQILESGLKRMYWDYNGDGLYDSREFTSSDGTLVHGFSTALDGTYDLSDSGEASR